MFGSPGSAPTVAPNSVQCQTMNPNDVPPAELPGVVISQWYWTATLNNVPDGILEITLGNPKSQTGAGTGV
jgi:alpha-1,3-glucan synthase